MMQKHTLIGRIASLTIIRVPGFGTRVSLRIERAGCSPVICCIAGDVAREFVVRYRPGDTVAVRGSYEARPSTASGNARWVGRFRVSVVRAEDGRLAA